MPHTSIVMQTELPGSSLAVKSLLHVQWAEMSSVKTVQSYGTHVAPDDATPLIACGV